MIRNRFLPASFAAGFIAVSVFFSGSVAFAQDTSAVASEAEHVASQKIGTDGMIPVCAADIATTQTWLPVEVESSSSMFRIKESSLYVCTDGTMLLRLSMSGGGYSMLFAGTGAQAAAAGQNGLILNEGDGNSVFTVPVQSLNTLFDCAAFSKKKQKWYDRTLCVLADTLPESSLLVTPHEPQKIDLKDGTYLMDVSLEGGSGRASVESPAKVTVSHSLAVARIVWSSPNYDYMKVNGEMYRPLEQKEHANASFEIPVLVFDRAMPVVADTVAMSASHEIHYRLTFDASSARRVRSVSIPFTVVISVLAVMLLAGVIFLIRRRSR